MVFPNASGKVYDQSPWESVMVSKVSTEARRNAERRIPDDRVMVIVLPGSAVPERVGRMGVVDEGVDLR